MPNSVSQHHAEPWKEKCFFVGHLLCMSPRWANAIEDLLEIRWTLSQAAQPDSGREHRPGVSSCKQSRQAFGQADPFLLWAVSPHHRCPCVSPLALVLLKDCPVLRTISKGVREESTGSLSETGTKASLSSYQSLKLLPCWVSCS